jgi:hypothetical protein
LLFQKSPKMKPVAWALYLGVQSATWAAWPLYLAVQSATWAAWPLYLAVQSATWVAAQPSAGQFER